MTSTSVSSIKVLPPDLISRIAAGEVVERPASIVKELVENALDAQASRIRVDLFAGGCELIRVSDDGAGMPPDDLKLAIQPHATSKLASADQLHCLNTLGFRGEALPSIASVSRFSIVSRQRPFSINPVNSINPVSPDPAGAAGSATAGVDGPAVSDGAWKIEVSGSLPEYPEPRPAAGSFGTTVEARELFFNLPARKKFLKGLASEAAACADTLLRLALTSPHTAFSLHQGRSELLDLPATCMRPRQTGTATASALPTAAYARRARAALGPANSANLLEVDFNDSVQNPQQPYRLFGLLSPPAVTRPNRALIYFTVNGRSVKDRTLASALLEAFRHLLPPRRFPLAVLYLELPASDVDVNVHPAKTEVRFRLPGRIYALFHHAVRSTCGLAQVPATGHQAGGVVSPAALAPHAPWADLKFAPQGPLFKNGVQTEPEMQPHGDDSYALWPTASQRTAYPDTVQDFAPPFGVENPGVDGSASFQNIRVQDLPGFDHDSNAASALPERASDHWGSTPDYRVIGQAAASYIVLEDESGVRLIDQHALHERILFEQLLAKAQAQSRGDAQGLLIPETLELSSAQAALVSADSETLELLRHLGFDCEPFGPRTLLVRSVPAILKSVPPGKLVAELLETLALGHDAPVNSAGFGASAQAVARWTLREKAAYILACKAALKAGERLTLGQMETLLREFHAVTGSSARGPALTCPHGRPLALEVSWYELERAVGRK